MAVNSNMFLYLPLTSCELHNSTDFDRFRVELVMTSSIHLHILQLFKRRSLPLVVMHEQGRSLCPVAVPEIKDFDRCHSLLLASSATGSARKRPHFDTPPNIAWKPCLNSINDFFEKCKH